MHRRRAIALGVGALFIWWGIQAAFLLDSLGALWAGTVAGGFVAALGHAKNGFDGAIEAVFALAIVAVVGLLGLAVWSLFRYGVDVIWLLADAADIFSATVVVRQRFLLPIISGGAAGGYVAREYLH